MKKLYSLGLGVVLTFGLAACSGNNSSSNNDGDSSSDKTEISVLIGKEEIATEFEETVDAFNESHDDINLSIIPLAGVNAFEKMTTLYSSGNAPTILNMGGAEMMDFQDKLLDLSDQPWVDRALEGTLDYATVDDKLIGMPVTVEGFGYIYNKEVLDEAAGGSFDPESIKSRDDLDELFGKVSDLDGTDAIQISPLDWSMGAHFTNLFITNQSSDREERHQFMSDLESGKVNLSTNDVYNGWVDTFDLMKKYNSAKKSPLSPQYDDGPLALGSGEIGLWFMGNWAYPQLKEANPDAEYGFLPVPVSDNAGDYGNDSISIGVPHYWSIDASQSTEAQQKAAKEFINWLVTDETGKDYYVNKLNFIPIYDEFGVEPKDSLSQDMLEFMNSDKTLEWMNNYYPADAYPTMGASLQKYLVDQIDREELTKEIENYWESAGE
jgi:raffinose/stachyose/melibiose transport system substrate-binding protein